MNSNSSQRSNSSENASQISPTSQPAKKKQRESKVLTPRTRLFFQICLALFVALTANSLYLGGVTFMEWNSGVVYQDYFYLLMFAGHLGLGFLLLVPFLIFSWGHIALGKGRPNRRAVRVGYALFYIALALLISGVALTRIEGFEIKNPSARSTIYWIHVISPIVAVWFYILHRLVGPKIQWRGGLRWAGALGVIIVGMIFLQSRDPRNSNQIGSKSGERYFFPSKARTATGNFIPERAFVLDKYCQECHQDAYHGWFASAHHVSSFNNPAYLFSVQETRRKLLERDGNGQATRWCAGCHDPAPFFTGAFEDDHFDMKTHPLGEVGVNCVTCHSITHVNSTEGNADYSIEEPLHYPFTFSDNPFLQWVNRQLIKAKPEFHSQTFLKPLHKTPEFCSTCHKVSLPGELTNYKEFLRGQNHYDNYHLSGVSGHGARSFYYPEHAQGNCNECHLPPQFSSDFGAKPMSLNRFSRKENGDPADGEVKLAIHDHLFLGANTAIGHWMGKEEIVQAQMDYLKNSVTVDIFGIKPGGSIESELIAPLRPEAPVLESGKPYLLEVVLRTRTLGHLFTQGTVDSNQVWVDVELVSDGKIIGRSGATDSDGYVDPWSHFVNVYMLDRHGNRVDRRNAEDIFTPLYNHQIPPGAGQVVHYGFEVPEDWTHPIEARATLKYRKFDTTYLKFVFGEDYENDLPVTEISTDRLAFAVGASEVQGDQKLSFSSPEWMRWNDYGIGLFLKAQGAARGELAQAEAAFQQVEKLGRHEGAVNLARVYFREGRLDEAVAALNRAGLMDPPAPRWTVAWFSAMVNKQNGYLDKAIEEFRSVLTDRYPELDERGFDFSQDYEAWSELGQTLFERSKMERRNPEAQLQFLEEAIEAFQNTLKFDSEHLTAHYNLAQIYAQTEKSDLAEYHRVQHEKFRPDDNARDKAVSVARRNNPAADHAAQAIVIYSLQRPGAPGLPDSAPAINAQ